MVKVFAKRTREAAAVRRARILDEAIGLIGERGYYGFTIKELAGRCGLTNPGLLHYFPSKTDVMLGVLSEIEARETDFLAPLLQFETGTPAAVLDVLRAIYRRATANPAMLRFLFEMQTESLDPHHPGHSWWQAREQKTLGFFTLLFRPYVADAETVARLVLAQMDGLALHSLRSGHHPACLADWDHALARLLPELHGAEHSA